MKDYFVEKMDRQDLSRSTYSPKVKNVGKKKMTYTIYNLAEDFRILSQFNTLLNTNNGTYIQVD